MSYPMRLYGYEGPRFVCFFWHTEMHHISFGVHLDIKNFNVEIHVPFGFLRIGGQAHTHFHGWNWGVIPHKTLQELSHEEVLEEIIHLQVTHFNIEHDLKELYARNEKLLDIEKEARDAVELALVQRDPASGMAESSDNTGPLPHSI